MQNSLHSINKLSREMISAKPVMGKIFSSGVGMISLLMLGSSTLWAQPANDNPCGAIALTVSNSCNNLAATNVAATATAGVPAPGCASYNGGDVWYTVTMPNATLTLNTTAGTLTDMGMAVYTAPSCAGAFTLRFCDDDNGPGFMPVLSVTTAQIAAGTTVYVRLWNFGGGTGTFSLCATAPIPPVNDDPCGALTLTPAGTCTYAAGSNTLATNTAGVPAPGCASYNGGDVWYTLSMPNATLTLDMNTGTLTDMGMAVYTAGSCGGTFTLISCDDDSSPNGFMPLLNITTGQVAAGTTIYVRLWNFGGGTGTFSICATAAVVVAPPANDNPCGALTLTPAGTCTYTSGTNVGATTTGNPTSPGCASYNGGDVWYTLTMPGTTLTVDMNTGGLTDMGMAIYTSTGCAGTFTMIGCDDDSSPNGFMPLLNVTTGQVAAGTTLYIRVWDFGGNQTGTFGICATSAAVVAPANDDPCGAITLTSAGTCVYVGGTNVNATGTVNPGDPGCAFYLGEDVWYQVAMPAGDLTLDMLEGTLTDMGMAVYTANNCAGTFTLLACDDDSSPNGLMPQITIFTGQVAQGTTLYVRLWNFFGGTGTFNICATETAPVVNNDDPCGALTLTSAGTCVYVGGTNVNATGTVNPGDPGCAFYLGEDVWYQVAMPAGDLTLDMLEGTLTDMGMAVYTANNCAGTFTLLACDDDSSPNGLMPQITITTGQVAQGTTIYIRLWNFFGGTGTFNICATETAPVLNNDDPCGAISLTSSGVCNYSFYDNLNSTATITPGDPGCAFFVDGDVWFTLPMPNGSLTLDMTEGFLTDMGMAVYTAGACGGPFTLIDCDDDSSPNGLMPQINLTTAQVAPGAQLYVRVWPFFGGLFGDFGICAQETVLGGVCVTLPDDCSMACDLGVLPSPPACNGGGGMSNGAPITNILTNEGATAENPYSAIIGCGGIPGNDMANPATDVWYSFQATGTSLDVDIQSMVGNPLNTPNVGLYLGAACGTLTPVFCDIGGGGSLTQTFSPIYPGQTYFLQISGGDPLDQGDFALTLQNNYNCDNCLLSADLTASPAPVNGVYSAGQTVTFCFQVNEYNQTAANWLHGVIIDPGAGWDLNTLTPTIAPASCDINPGANWSWYNSVTGQATGNTYGNGFYYETNLGSNCACFNGNPGDNYGDPYAGLAVNSCYPMFCWEITTPQAGSCVDGASLNMTVNTTGDSESGSWISSGCSGDPDYYTLATLSCCTNPLITSSDAACGVNNGTATATGQGNGPWDYVWEDAGGIVLGTATNLNGPLSITGLAPAQYFVTVTDAINCVTSGVATVAQSNLLLPIATNGGPYCLGQTIVLSETSVAGATYTWSGPNGYSGSGQSVSIPNAVGASFGDYTVTADLGGGCSGTATTTVSLAASPVILASSNSPCVGRSIQLSAQGAATYTWTGPLGYSNTGAAPDRDNSALNMSGTYTVIGTTAGGCTGSTTVNVTVVTCVEICGNGVDDDADGQIDTDDPDCPCGN